MPLNKIPLDFRAENKNNVSELHSALSKLKLPVSDAEKKTKTIESSTTEAIKKFQTENNLEPTGTPDTKTVSALNTAIHDSFITKSKFRTEKLHELLNKVNIGVEKDEVKKRTTGESTRKAIEKFQEKTGLAIDGKLSEDVWNKLNDEAIRTRLNAKTQVGIIQSMLHKVGEIGKLGIHISDEEIKSKTLGQSSIESIRAFQSKYRLPVTGTIDKATLDKLKSVAASKGSFFKRMGKPVAQNLQVISKPVRINKVSAHVANVQKALSFMGYKISDKEFKTQTFGFTTRKAVLAFQKSKGLPLTGHIEKADIKALNAAITTVNPAATTSQKSYHVRGSVRDELWERQPNRVIKIFEKFTDGESAQPLASKRNFVNGFFDITYAPPVDKLTGKVKDKFHLSVKLYEPVDNNPANDKLLKTQLNYNVNKIQWVNFTAGDAPYAGDSEYLTVESIIKKAIGSKKIEEIKETADEKQVTQLSMQTGLDTDEIMSLILSYLVANSINKLVPLSPEVFFCFIRQGLPSSLPGDLLRGTSEWETINQMTELTSSGIVFLEDTLQQQTIDNALAQNIVSRKILANRTVILDELKNQRTLFALEKPILIGNQNLKTLLSNTKIDASKYARVSEAFISSKGINTDFWYNLKTNPDGINNEAIGDFTTTVELGNITKNHIDTANFFKSKIGTDQRFSSASSFAKLTRDDIIGLINENGKKVPDNIPGDNIDDKVSAYASAIKNRSEVLFPAVSLVAEIKRSNTSKLSKVQEIESFIDNNPDISFKRVNIDKYLLDNNIQIEPEVRAEIKTVQRVHKLSPNPQSASVLINEGLHSSMQVYFAGKSKITNLMTSKGVEKNKAAQVYEAAKMQYLQVLQRFIDYRKETNTGTPAAIVSPSYTIDEVKAVLGDIPNLETLFGTQDFCDCKDCKSLYGPAAYLTDILRFINEHDSLEKKDSTNFFSVKEILFKRRPDLGNIKLNCENTNVALPYIDLVCEILENNIEPPQTNFSYQTTLSEKELRAIPEYIRHEAYETLAGSKFPIYSSFNLFQEEARTYLNYLRVPRYELMETFQDISNPASKTPDDITIAAEYFGISSFEQNVIITQNLTDQDKFWGLDTTKTKIAVKDFMDRTRLSYVEVLELLLVRFLNDPDAPDKCKIERPVDTCDTSVQQINNLTTGKFDLFNRFIRLWKKTGWQMWELDLLIRNPKVGNGVINGTTLVNLKLFRQLQDKIKFDVESLLAMYGDLNREVRIEPDNPDVKIDPLYKHLFQNIAITNPIDSHFIAVDDNDQPKALDSSIKFEVNFNPHSGYTPIPTVLSALAIKQTELELIINKTDNHLSIASLSTLFRYAYLAKSMQQSINDLTLFLAVTNTVDPFSSLQATIDLINDSEYIKNSGMSLIDLDYILNYNPASPAGLRKETYVQFIEELRKILDDSQTTEIELQALAAFDADSLNALTDSQFMPAFTPFQNKAASLKNNLTNNAFTPEDANYILSFSNSMVNSVNRTKLIATIKKLQQNVNDLITNLETQKLNQIKSQVASSFGISDNQSNILLKNLSIAPDVKKLINILDNKKLIEKLPDQSFKWSIDETNFPDIFKAYMLVHKAGLLVSGLKLNDTILEWFVINQDKVHVLNFSALPVASFTPPNKFNSWLNLEKFINFKNTYPEPEDASICSILNLGSNPANPKSKIFDEINKLTKWDKDDIQRIDSGFKFSHNGQLDYTNADTYIRMKKCFNQMKLTGVDADTMFSWADRDDQIVNDVIVSQQTRQAIKSKYEQEDWLEKVTPLHNVIREKKRTALTSFLIENSQRTQSEEITFNGQQIPNPLYWKDNNSLFKYLLIDVEMGSCMMTSRIKQAINSVQLFVQRCFLNLENRFVLVTADEKEDKASANSWAQWKWMKNYRIWEANRQIFFYPENWLEPELRDDKSPFFEELENEILQNEINDENVESAFMSYLHKVDEVSHLEVCGLYHEMENLSGDETMYEINNVHVIGRTKSVPHIYYYRKYDMNYSNWTAWEKIDIDILGDNVVPVIYNRKLHLFWLIIVEKPMKMKKVPPAKPTTGPTDSPEPLKTMEIQLAWSIKKENGWTTKKISRQKMVHPWERPQHTYNLRPYYKPKRNLLYLDLYLSTSQEFNDHAFYDPFAPPEKNPVFLTKNRFNETYLPWHSSSFIFNGEVQDIELKPINGSYYIPNNSTPQSINSYIYVYQNFGELGKEIKSLELTDTGPRLKLPNGMHFNYEHLTNNQVHNINTSQLRVLENTATTNLLNTANSPFDLVITQQDLQLDTLIDHPLFYQDNQRAFYIKPEWENVLNNYGQVISHNRKYRFQPFYHPYTNLFLREFNRSGTDGLLKRSIQTSAVNSFDFYSYSPTTQVVLDKDSKGNLIRKDIVDFSYGGAYSGYNWELFFHAPLLIANKLMQNQKFEEAMKWFHYIFNPTDIENLPVPQRYWITKPFFEYNSDDYRKQRIENILTNINLAENQGQLIAWRNNPFKPHLIARLRPVAYQKNVVMKYIDNLIAWGDMLFNRDTIESINEATLLYMLAYEILGDRPQKVPDVTHDELTFNELEPKLDEFGNARVDVVIEDTLLPIMVVPSATDTEPIPKIETLYFGIPNNTNLLKYWDTVEDRLYKIRNCMNIEGIVRQLPLFEPPFDPALLVKAAAAGIDINSVLNEISAPVPQYRFRFILQRALEFCNEVKMLGEKLLSVLEKKDAEELSLLRSQNEIQLLNAIKEVRQKQIDETVEIIGSLNKSLEIADEKFDYYRTQPYMNECETSGVILHTLGIVSEAAGTVVNLFGAGISMVPDGDIGASGFGGTPAVKLKFGGTNFGNAASKGADFLRGLSAVLHSSGSLLDVQGAFLRKYAENQYNFRTSKIEKQQIQFQINTAQIRQAIAEKELDNQELQIEQSQMVDDYLQNKYTNKQLFSWMITQTSAVYFQAYQLAYDMALKAAKSYEYELGLSGSDFIKFGYWDSLKKGLLAGEKLMNDIRRLEAAYIDQNKREYEIIKNISLAQMFPLALIKLKETGKCIISIPEWIFDMDYPGHYMRRIKNVSISMPSIVGPYTGVNCTLSLLKNETRVEPLLNGSYTKTDENDTRFRSMFGAISSIVTSSGQNDNGMFELNFNDERYFPFEGAGVESDWLIDMPIENNYFDYNSLSDVIMRISYTSRPGGGALTTAANSSLQAILPSSTARLFSLKHEFSSEWYKFFNPQGNNDQELVLTMKPEHFPFFIRGKLNTLKIKSMDLFIETSESTDFKINVKLTNKDYVNDLTVSKDLNFNNVQHLGRDLSSDKPNALGEVRLNVKQTTAGDFKSLTEDKIEDIMFLVQMGV